MSDLLLDMTKTPYGWPLMAEAYVGLVSHLIGDEDAIEAFQKDTGHDLRGLVPKNVLDSLIDESTGRTRAVLSEFMDWVVVNHWGEEGK